MCTVLQQHLNQVGTITKRRNLLQFNRSFVPFSLKTNGFGNEAPEPPVAQNGDSSSPPPLATSTPAPSSSAARYFYAGRHVSPVRMMRNQPTYSYLTVRIHSRAASLISGRTRSGRKKKNFFVVVCMGGDVTQGDFAPTECLSTCMQQSRFGTGCCFVCTKRPCTLLLLLPCCLHFLLFLSLSLFRKAPSLMLRAVLYALCTMRK